MSDSYRQEDNLFVFAAEHGATQGSIDFGHAPAADPDDNNNQEHTADLNQAPLADLGHNNLATADFDRTPLVDADHNDDIAIADFNHLPFFTANFGTQHYAEFGEQEYLSPTGPDSSQTILGFPGVDPYENLFPNTPTLDYGLFQAEFHSAPSPPHHPSLHLPTEPRILSDIPTLPVLTPSTGPQGEPSSIGALRSTRALSRYCPTQPRSRSSASHSQTGSTTATYPFVDTSGSEGFISALSGAGTATDRWKNMMNNAPDNSMWRAVIKGLDVMTTTYINLCVTRDFTSGLLPNREKITLLIRNLLTSPEVTRRVSHLGTSKYSAVDNTGVLTHWHTRRPLANLHATHSDKVVWVSRNPYVIRLGEAANESYFELIGDTIRRMRNLCYGMVLSVWNTPSGPLECRSADFSFVHIYGEGDALDISALFGAENTNQLINYYGHASFQGLMADIIKPHIPFLAYAVHENCTPMLMTLMAIPAAMVAAATHCCHSGTDESASISEAGHMFTTTEKTQLRILGVFSHALAHSDGSQVNRDTAADRLLHRQSISAHAQAVIRTAWPEWEGPQEFITRDDSPSKKMLLELAQLLRAT